MLKDSGDCRTLKDCCDCRMMMDCNDPKTLKVYEKGGMLKDGDDVGS